ncbi:hypothetical protein IV203_029905 [Nitzschia inconspicua]|uniref:F-box domain-containing protein n=1 Tax=Nitzschia inconspicua TaxID=303405 RepID=A0A9K3LRK2_9STRA|nr:hypothetical protein IV203_029905 [Nitzschia inconspicua]
MAATFATVVEHEVAFRNVLEFLGQPMDLVRLEQTSRPIRQFLAGSDDVWWSCVDYTSFRNDPRLTTARDKILTDMMVKRYQKSREEENGQNIFFRCLFPQDVGYAPPSLRGLKRYLREFKTQNFPWQRGFPVEEPMVYRDDTCITFAGVLEANMVEILEQSLVYANHRTSDSGYPIVENRDIARASNKLVEERYCMEFKERSDDGRMVPFEMPKILPVQEGIIRGLAFRAGIIRLHSETFETIWDLTLKLTALILTRTGIISAHHREESVPLLPLPDMVTAAAELLNLPYTKVYLDNLLGDEEEGDEDDDDEEDKGTSQYQPDSEDDEDDLQADFEEWNEVKSGALEDSDYDSEEDEDYEYLNEDDVDLDYDTDD